MDKKKIKETIKRILSRKEDVVFSYLFGSFLETDKFNDIDIAIYVKDKQTELLNLTTDLKIEISKELQKRGFEISPDNIDIMVINHAELIILKNVFQKGELLISKDETIRTDFLEKLSLRLRECEGIFRELQIV